MSTKNAPAQEVKEPIAPASQTPSGAALAMSGSSPMIRVNLNEIYFTRDLNVREDASYSDIEDLKVAIQRTGGLLQPPGVYQTEPSVHTQNKKYIAAYGFRRLFCLEQLAQEDPKYGTNIPVMVLSPDTKAGVKANQLIENLHRKGITHLEIARGIKDMLDDTAANLLQRDIAGMLALKESQVSQYLKLLTLPKEVQQSLSKGEISFSHARILSSDVPASRVMEFAELAKKMKFGDFEEKVAMALGATTADGKGTVAAGGDAGGTQKRPVLMRASKLTDTLVPFLEKKIAAADSEKKLYTGKDLESARLDAIKTVLQAEGSKLAEEIKPFEEAQAKAVELEKAKADAVKNRESFFNDRVKEVKHLLEAPVDPSNPDAERPKLAALYTQVAANVAAMLKDEEKKKALGFDLNMDTFVQDLGKHYAEVDKKAKEQKAKRDAEKAAAEAKKKAEEAAKVQLDQAAAGVSAEVAPTKEELANA